MKNWIIAIAIFALGLAVADLIFGVDVPRLFSGFGQFLRGILRGGSS